MKTSLCEPGMAVSARHSRTPAVCGPGSPWGLLAGSLCGSLEPLPSVFGVVALPQRWQDQEEWELVILGVNPVAGLSRGTALVGDTGCRLVKAFRTQQGAYPSVASVCFCSLTCPWAAHCFPLKEQPAPRMPVSPLALPSCTQLCPLTLSFLQKTCRQGPTSPSASHNPIFTA